MSFKIVDDFEKSFGNLILSHSFDYKLSEKDLRIAHHIVNENIFDSKLDEKLKIVIVPYTGQPGKGSFRFGNPNGDGITIKQDFRFVQNANDNFFKIVCVLCHEMIHQYDFNFGRWSTFTNKLSLKTDFKLKKQFIGEYEIHDNNTFETYMKIINGYRFNVTKLYSAKDGIFMKRLSENENLDSESFFSDSNVKESDELDHSTMNLETAKKMFSHLKSSDDINMVVKPNGAWMIEVY